MCRPSLRLEIKPQVHLTIAFADDPSAAHQRINIVPPYDREFHQNLSTVPNHKQENQEFIMPQELLRNIATEVQLFNTLEQKESFLFILGALAARIISFKKASEVLNLEPESFLQILDLMGIEFSYLTKDDIAAEKTWQ
jgi:predicted HTH domain antitoxin